MKIDPIRQKSGKVVKNCELYEKMMEKEGNVVEMFQLTKRCNTDRIGL